MDIISLATGAAIATVSMSAATAYMWQGWHRVRVDNLVANARLTAASDAHLIAKGRADAAERGLQAANARIAAVTNERDAVQGHLSTALDRIIEMEPLAAIGARRQAQWRANNAKRMAK